MQWRVREIRRGVFEVQQKGGLFWVCAIWDHSIWDSFKHRFCCQEDAIKAAQETKREYDLDHAFKPRTVWP